MQISNQMRQYSSEGARDIQKELGEIVVKNKVMVIAKKKMLHD